MNKWISKISLVISLLPLFLSVSQSYGQVNLFPSLASGYQNSATNGPAPYTRLDGTVYLRDDGKEFPVPGALVEIYMLKPFKTRVETRTSKRGFYTQNGVMRDGKYLIIVSGPKIEPTWVSEIEPDVKNTINVYARPGDGSRLTFDQVLLLISKSITRSTGARWGALAQVKTAVPEATAIGLEEARKKYEVQTESDVEMLSRFDQARKQYRRGMESFKKENYKAAVSELEEATAAMPFPAPPAFADLFVKSNLAAAETRYTLGVVLYNDSERDEAKTYFERAIAATLRVIKSDLAQTDSQGDLIACYDILTKNALIMVEHFGVTDPAVDTLKALDQAQIIDAANKGRWATLKGKLLVLLGRTDEAADVFLKVFAYDPKNLEALYGMSLIYGVSPDRDKLQKAMDYMSDFIGRAPATDNRVQEMKALLESVKTQISSMETSSSKKKP